MADNSILPKSGAPLVDQTGRPTRAFYTFFNALVSNLQGQINTISKLVKNLALVIAALGGDPDSGEGIPDISGQIDAKADKSITITGLGSIQGGGDLSQNRFISLDGDVDTVPGVSFYGSPDGATKGWAAFSDNFAPSMDADDNVTLDLADLANSGTGAALVKITRDAKGRISGTSAATTTDLAEGDNLYFTDERAQDAVVVSGITDGDTDHSPSGDAVFDALALKIDSSEKAAANGVATLGADAKLDSGQLPALAITETFVVNTQAAMLALDCQQGDVAVRTDLSQSLILTAEPASTLANWQELLVPTGGVTSFNGRTGSVTPASGDYTFAQIGSKPTTLAGYGITDAEPAITAGTATQYWRGDKSWQTLNKAAVGLGNVDNTSDANKPVSTAQAAALATKEPAITAGTAAQFVRGNKTVGNTIIGGGIGTFPGNNTAGTTAVCYEVGTDIAGRGASIKSRRGAASPYTGMVLSSHNASGDLDLVFINDDSTVNFGTTLYVNEVSGRVGIGAPAANYQFEVAGPVAGVFLNRSGGAESFILLQTDSSNATGGQIRGLTTGNGLRLTSAASGQPTMLSVTPTVVDPGTDNAATLGSSSKRWSVVYAATGVINTSDAREKTAVDPLTTAELAAAAELARAIGTYQWLASIADKGAGNARHHAGLTVQRAIQIMQDHSLDPFRYGFICFDEWPETPEQRDPETDDVVQEYQPAGDRYSFRHDELLLFLARGFAARLDALESA